MANILGIDVGGTYTDGALVSFCGGNIIAKTKTPTLHNDLKNCIRACISKFTEEQRADIARVCLSTTLATNAVVEGNQYPTGLILVGGVPKGALPTENVWELDGGVDIMGHIKKPLDIEGLKKAAEQICETAVAVAISGYASVRNPALEKEAAEYIRANLGMPVVCAHELSGNLGFYERTVTAVFNAGLIPLICDLIDSVEMTLREFKIDAPLMIVRGNGMLMTAEQARLRPIETIMSGPAASIAGGVFLSGSKEALILDMGGTTTDMARVSGGNSKIREKGAYVGGWNTRVQALEVFTCGLGGDSRIRKNISGEAVLEPERVIPYCRAGLQYPKLREEIIKIAEDPERPFLYFAQNDAEAFLTEKEFIPESEAEAKLRDELKDGPHTVYELRKRTELGNTSALLAKMAKRGDLGRIALTPTDILHATGEMTIWDKKLSEAACIIALGSKNADIYALKEAVFRKLTDKILKAAFFFDGKECNKPIKHFCEYLVRDIFDEHKGTLFDASPSLKVPVVAIGAPSGAWAHIVKERLNTEVLVPEDGEVAGAVGAAVGRVLEQENMLIRCDHVMKKYILFSAEERSAFETLDEATQEAEKIGKKLTLLRLPKGEKNFSVKKEDIYAEEASTERIFVERRITVTTSVIEDNTNS